MSGYDLPDDVVEVLKTVTVQPDGHLDPDIAELLDRYRKGPRPLEGEFQWVRRYVAPSGFTFIEGGHPKIRDRPGDDFQPWPDLEGIDPAELLNDGWQIRPWNQVPIDWQICGYDKNPWRFTKACVKANDNWEVPHVLRVFCRPPRDHQP